MPSVKSRPTKLFFVRLVDAGPTIVIRGDLGRLI